MHPGYVYPGGDEYTPEEVGVSGDAEHIPFLMVRTKDPGLTGESKKVLVYAETYSPPGDLVEQELYDLQTDLPQVNSLHADSTRNGSIPALQAKLNALKVCNGRTPPTPAPNPCPPLENRGDGTARRPAPR